MKNGSIPLFPAMKQCAIVKNGDDIVKVSNLKRKYNKIQANPLMSILEECDLEELETKYNYYKDVYKKEETNESEDIELYYYQYIHKPHLWLVSIYSNEEIDRLVLRKPKEEYLNAIKK